MRNQKLAEAAHRMWLRVQEPRALSVIYFFAYIAIGVLGLAVVTDPPRTVQTSLGHTLLIAWGAMLLIGGGLGTVSVLPGIWWLERAASSQSSPSPHASSKYGTTPTTQKSRPAWTQHNYS
jgi:hypothetical protein